ncbi:hypothetical protein PR048_029230 [Dryococelus australis]|uniref:Uncharacterized protein n=1 Tax=Dryococelus australis TaxID=614101 RepID=A0ABQ9GCS7_9NEOP|nr:hypothetical protein PR048_029230 [Dryococelus australis]
MTESATSGVVVRLLASHQGEQSSIPTPGFSHVGIVPDDGAGRRVFWGISRFLSPCFLVLPHTHLTLSSLALKTSMLRAAQISSLTRLYFKQFLKVAKTFHSLIIKIPRSDINKIVSYESVNSGHHSRRELELDESKRIFLISSSVPVTFREAVVQDAFKSTPHVEWRPSMLTDKWGRLLTCASDREYSLLEAISRCPLPSSYEKQTLVDHWTCIREDVGSIPRCGRPDLGSCVVTRDLSRRMLQWYLPRDTELIPIHRFKLYWTHITQGTRQNICRRLSTSWSQGPTRVKQGEYEAALQVHGRGKREIPEKTHRPKILYAGSIPREIVSVARRVVRPGLRWDNGLSSPQIPTAAGGSSLIRSAPWTSAQAHSAPSRACVRLAVPNIEVLRADEGDPREDLLTSGIVWHDSLMLNSGGSSHCSVFYFTSRFFSSVRKYPSHVGIVPDNATGQPVFSEISGFPRRCILLLLYLHLASPSLGAQADRNFSTTLYDCLREPYPMYVPPPKSNQTYRCKHALVVCCTLLLASLHFRQYNAARKLTPQDVCNGSLAARFAQPIRLKAVHDKMSTSEIYLRRKSLLLAAYILTGALSDLRPVKLVTMDEKVVPYLNNSEGACADGNGWENHEGVRTERKAGKEKKLSITGKIIQAWSSIAARAQNT